ncbi:hypothetical protein SAMN04488020_106218 [Palleronia marisminoris]|uniref:Uncharacterized protein n=1 Tax=Palleronia marisminoris TaxID=315423 RepID=A0A1Y5T0C6_9RHOB|nr:hypothetical protein [Palleronia marisminoris]SFH09304.1 hypothetical protein SAMN04488020_106218 [Palleronia marisminoris]SLN52501.1 hypothetical protein PAM7066_02453 [Palleronia marisminoris]
MEWVVTASALERGVWTLRREDGETPPKIEIRHAHRHLSGIRTEIHGSALILSVELPREVLSDGLQSIHAVDGANGTTLASLHIAAGRATWPPSCRCYGMSSSF